MKNHIGTRGLWVAVVWFVCLPNFTFAQDIPFRVMTYNALKFSDNDQNRQSHFEVVFRASQPDIVVMQEVVDNEGADILLAALNADSLQFAKAPFVNGYDTDNAFFYREGLVAYISQDTIATALREISEYTVRIAGNYLRIYSAHLKAGDGPYNENLRYDEVLILRDRLDALPDSTEFILLGDLNLSESNEAAYQLLVEDRGDQNGRLRDLADSSMIGKWENNPKFAAVHSQSPRSVAIGGGASGGMDDRFDFILSSFDMNDDQGVEYVDGSYTVFGNDGLHFNKAVNDGLNLAVSEEVANALHDASDHLPVYADFVSFDPSFIPALLLSEIFYDTPGIDADEEWVELYYRGRKSLDLAGWSIVDNNGTGSTYTFSEGIVMQPNSHLTLANDPLSFFSMYGYDADIYSNFPRLNNSGDALLLLNPEGEVKDQVAWEGGASSGLPLSWESELEPRAIRGESLVRKDLLQDSDSYLDWAIAGNNGNPEVQSGVLEGVSGFSVAADASIDLVHTFLGQNYPNPFRTQTTIEYELGESQQVQLTVYDLLGREIQTLVDQVQFSGTHRAVFDGSNLAAGIYIYQLKTPTFSSSRQLVILQ